MSLCPSAICLGFMPATLGVSNVTKIESALSIQGLSDEVEVARGGDVSVEFRSIMALVVVQ